MPKTLEGQLTAKGFRFFVDTLLRVQPVGRAEMQELRVQIDNEASDSQSLAATTSNLLSTLTRCSRTQLPPHYSWPALRAGKRLPGQWASTRCCYWMMRTSPTSRQTSPGN